MTEKKTKKRYLIGIAVAFVVPLSFYLIANSVSGNKVRLPPYYIAERVDSQLTDGRMRYDTVYHKVRDLRLVNQFGRAVSLNEDLEHKILLINFIFTNCASICPKLTDNMAVMQRAFRKTGIRHNDTLVQFLSITVDPERDSFPALRRYAEERGINQDKWWLLTGDKKTIYDFARHELGLSTGPGDGGADDFIHTEKFVLLDRKRHIRGYYNGLDSSELMRCAQDIGWLAIEKR